MFRPGVLSALIFCAALGSARAVAEEEAGAPAGAKTGAAAAQSVTGSRASAVSSSRSSQELLAIQNRIRDARTKALETRRSQNERLKDLGAENRSVQRTLDVLEEEIAKREREIREKKEALQGEEKEVEKLKKPTETMLAALRGFLDKVEAKVAAGIAWKIELRKNSISGVRDLLKSPGTSPASGLAALGRVQQEEEALGRLVESGTVEIDAGKDRLAVQAFHLGLLGVIFANDDGTVLGFAKAGQKLEDGLDVSIADGKAAYAYMAAVDMLRRRRTPSLLDLYFPALPVRKGGKEP
jgi:flagellar motility protein MotE (MotC chaperone)